MVRAGLALGFEIDAVGTDLLAAGIIGLIYRLIALILFTAANRAEFRSRKAELSLVISDEDGGEIGTGTQQKEQQQQQQQQKGGKRSRVAAAHPPQRKARPIIPLLDIGRVHRVREEQLRMIAAREEAKRARAAAAAAAPAAAGDTPEQVAKKNPPSKLSQKSSAPDRAVASSAAHPRESPRLRRIEDDPYDSGSVDFDDEDAFVTAVRGTWASAFERHPRGDDLQQAPQSPRLEWGLSARQRPGGGSFDDNGDDRRTDDPWAPRTPARTPRGYSDFSVSAWASPAEVVLPPTTPNELERAMARRRDRRHDRFRSFRGAVQRYDGGYGGGDGYPGGGHGGQQYSSPAPHHHFATPASEFEWGSGAGAW
jgi:hypothetical protein